VVAAIAAELARRVQADDGYFARLRQLIDDALTPMRQKQAVQRVLASGFRIDDADWRRIVGDDDSVQASVAQHLCEGRFGDFTDLGGLFNVLQNKCDRDDRETLLGTLRNYWIPLILSSRLADAVGKLAPYPAGTLPPPNLVLVHAEGERPFDLAEMYRDRQFVPYDCAGRLEQVDSTLGTGDALVNEVARSLGLEPAAPDAAQARADLIAELDELRRRRLPEYCFLHLEAPATPEPLLVAARTWWPCVFIVTAPQPRHAEFALRLNWTDPQLPGGPPDVRGRLREISRALGYIQPARNRAPP
jgi:hypothetical protein